MKKFLTATLLSIVTLASLSAPAYAQTTTVHKSKTVNKGNITVSYNDTATSTGDFTSVHLSVVTIISSHSTSTSSSSSVTSTTSVSTTK